MKKLLKASSTLAIVVIILLVGAFLVLNNMYNKDNAEQSNMTNTRDSNIEIVPIEHATMVLKWGDKIIYTDPVGGADAFSGQPVPDIILLTDIHGDHLDVETLKAVSKEKTILISPRAVADKLTDTLEGTVVVLNNGEKTSQQNFSVEAIPMYNLPEKSDGYHVKGRGNGYIVEFGDKRVYISGDTSDTPEMRNLKNIDIAFISMNLPYTMSVESAASGVLAFKPRRVYPYHYRQSPTKDFDDVNKFKSLVNIGDPNIEVILLNWYPK